MNFKSLLLFTLLFLVSLFTALAQKAEVYGKVVDSTGSSIESVTIIVNGEAEGVISDRYGRYKIEIPANQDVTLVFSFIGYQTIQRNFNLKTGERVEYNPSLKESSYKLGPVNIEDKTTLRTPMERLDPKDLETMPNPSGNLEALLKTFAGVSGVNELSSSYSVRGGNYDENLIYVNDILIYRPFLVRSGRQEGLSFINSSLVSSVLFSSGGFESKYGDKMSSVLDVKYKKPSKFGGGGEISLLGGGVHLEGAPGNRFGYLMGYRYRTNQYLLSSLETQGDYQPSFNDFQAYLTYDINDRWELSFLGNYSQNNYQFVPENRTTSFGTVQQALQLQVYFDGQEVTNYETYFGALTNTWRPNSSLSMKFIVSGFRTFEDENFDVQGQYFIGELERDLSEDNFGDVAFNRGVGTYLNHARNSLFAEVFTVENRSKYAGDKHAFEWGAKWQHELIEDELSEWSVLDSNGYLVPRTPDTPGDSLGTINSDRELVIPGVLRSDLGIESNRYTGYFQFGRFFDRHSFNIGVRANHWDLNGETVISPRGNYAYIPDWKRDVIFRFASGYYYQPPFYRELRNFQGELNTDVKAQRSIHFVAGADYNFKAWGRPFKYTAEVYYKHQTNVIPYELDNVRIRYYAENNANAYATGIDMKINGEFVKGVESWASMSLMQTQEDILDDFYYDYFNSDGEKIIAGFTANDIAVDSVKNEPGYIPRPTDQRFNFSVSFQDYIPNNPSYKMHITMFFATGLPFGPPSQERFKDTLRLPSYRRVDIGFSKSLISKDKKPGEKSIFRHFKSLWINVEVFNLLQINNVISQIWITDITGRQYAVPNFLTSRRLNVRLQMKF